MGFRLVASMGAVAALAGCGSHTSGRSVLYGGVSSDAVSRIVHHIGDREAMIAGRANLRLLKRQLQIRARKAPHQVFKNPPQDLLKSALHSEARSNHFRVVSIQMLRPRQLAPKIVVETTHYLALARATPSILVRLDPRRPSADDRKGWAYEGFYFEAEDERNVPFLIVSNFWRGRNGGGGQFARSDALFPYPHG